MHILEVIRSIVIHRNELQTNKYSKEVDVMIYEANYIITLLKSRVDATLKRQPKLNRIVLYLFYYKLYSWEEIMNQFEIEIEDIQIIREKFQDDFYESESDFDTE